MSITIVNLSMFFQNSNGEKRQKLLQSVSDYKQANNYQCALSAGLDQSGPVYLGCSNTNTTNNLNIQGHSLEGCCELVFGHLRSPMASMSPQDWVQITFKV